MTEKTGCGCESGCPCQREEAVEIAPGVRVSLMGASSTQIEYPQAYGWSVDEQNRLHVLQGEDSVAVWASGSWIGAELIKQESV